MVDRKVPPLYVFMWIAYVVTAKYCETFDPIYAQSRRDRSGNMMCNLSWYLGCVFEHHEMNGVVKMTQIAFVDSN